MLFRASLLRAFGCLAVCSCLFAQPDNLRIDTAHSSAQFSVRHMMISTVHGQFGGVKGAVLYDPKNVAASSVEATIDCTTINTGEPKRDADLKSEKFFDVEHFPVMKFKSKRVEQTEPGKLKVVGDLTIKGTTNEVVLDVDGPTPYIRDNQGREKAGVSAKTTLSRKAFGITYNTVIEGGGVTIGDEVSINLDLELVKNSTAGQ